MGDLFHIAPGCEPMLAVHGLTGMEAVFAWDRGERLDKNQLEPWRQRWRLVLKDRQAERTFYLKRFDRPPLRRQLARCIAGEWASSFAGIEWDRAHRLAAAGIPGPQPVAFGQCMRGPLEARSFVLIAEVPGESLERWVPAQRPDGDRLRAYGLIDTLARFVADFHRRGFVHRDLYLSHIFIADDTARGDDDTKGPAFTLIDLQRVFRPRWRRRRWVVKDLAALNFSTPLDRISARARLRFLARYVRACDRFGSARRLARLIGRKTARMSRSTSISRIANCPATPGCSAAANELPGYTRPATVGRCERIAK